MRQRLPLTVTIIAQNEADRIHHTIASVRPWVEEVLVVDSGSTDNTQELAEMAGATVVFHAWKGYGPQKIFAEQLAQYDWILNLDADEAVSPALRDELMALFAEGAEPEKAAYRFPIRTIFPWDTQPRWGAPRNDPPRLYDRTRAGFKDSTVHDSVVVRDGSKPGKLKGAAWHRSFRSYHHMLEKINRYSSMQAADMLARGKCPSSLRLVVEPLFAFGKAYFQRRYIWFGLDGFIESVIYAFARFIRLAKAREAHKLARLKAGHETKNDRH